MHRWKLKHSLFPRKNEEVPGDKAMVKGLRKNPSDKDAWNVYADFVCENGQDDRAAFIRRWNETAASVWTRVQELLKELVITGHRNPLSGMLKHYETFSVSAGDRHVLKVELDHDCVILDLLSRQLWMGTTPLSHGRFVTKNTHPTLGRFYRNLSMLFCKAAEFDVDRKSDNEACREATEEMGVLYDGNDDDARYGGGMDYDD